MVVGGGYRTELRAWGVRSLRKKGVQNKEMVVGEGYRTELRTWGVRGWRKKGTGLGQLCSVPLPNYHFLVLYSLFDFSSFQYRGVL